ncbi:class I SAM-dependent DNA methyltransferase [Pedobacter helvus]|uniref:site-specific DNA-methyltransferase (adenine-specific) n=1 Tax=Pedobacter helvus TaxID=2563444 RepID=A0ABW9JFL6_9SPHI|nr:DNA methyltransferase [Pedobacter ureilyticus]
MTSKEIEANLEKLIANINNEEFIYELLLAYGISKTSVNRLKKGDFNLSKITGEVLYKNKLFFTYAETDLHLKVDEFATDEKLLKQNPRFVIVTDYKTLVAKDLKTKLNRDFPLKELPKYFDFFLPLTGAEVYKSSNDNKADRDAAYKMAQLYDILVQDNPDFKEDSHKLNIFLSRLLFCFFAEDTGIFEKSSIFTETLSQHTNVDGRDVDEFLNSFFQRLNTEKGSFPDYLQNQFPYVNGGLFRNNVTSPKFSSKARTLLLSCGDLDWSEINPDIFGSMIQAVADPEERSDLGMHYTSVPNIKKLIEPLFLDELNSEYEKQYDSITGLNKLIARLGQIKFFDPACGSGNFLIITYKEIRLLEIEIIKRIIDLTTKQGFTIPLQFTIIKLSQFYGIEIKDFAHEMAILSLWLAEHQMNRVFDERLEGYGQSKPILPLKQAGNIICGNATRIDWKIVCPVKKDDEVYILGNPPYYGARKQNEEQKGDIAFTLNSIKGANNLDYIAIWFFKAKKYIENLNAKFAFVTTNSICQGEQVSNLWPTLLKDNIELEFAYHSFKWTNNAIGNAGVTVIIIGARNLSTQPKFLYTDNIKKEVKNINAYLIDVPNIYVLPRTKPLSKFPEMNFGSMPNDGGSLLLNRDEKSYLTTVYPNSLKLIKKFAGGAEFLQGIEKYCIWINEDTLPLAQNISPIRERINQVRKLRGESNRMATVKLAKIPFAFGENRHQETDSIIVPATSSERRTYIPIGFLNSETVISNSAMAIYGAQPWLFGIIHSKMHMIWVDNIGGKLKTDYRYSAKLVYNTFPFPEINVKQKENINQYVFDILDERAKYPEKTMAWMYNPDTMPSTLKLAHKALDEAIERIYRLAPFTTDAERLAHLFKLYEEMAKKDTLFAKIKTVKKLKSK